jgi:hypothetical protein
MDKPGHLLSTNPPQYYPISGLLLPRPISHAGLMADIRRTEKNILNGAWTSRQASQYLKASGLDTKTIAACVTGAVNYVDDLEDYLENNEQLGFQPYQFPAS